MKRASTRKHLVKNCAERKNIRALIDNSTLQLFRRHVTNRTHHHTRIGINASCRYFCLRLMTVQLRELRQTEIENLQATVVGNENIFRFQIAMDDSLLVCRRKPIRKLRRIIDRATLSQGSAPNAFA